LAEALKAPEEYPLLSGPFEWLPTPPDQTQELRVLRWELGSAVIAPRWRGAPPQKRIRVLRLWVPAEVKPIGVPWWDVDASTLIAQLLPFLTRADYREKLYRITAYQEPPRKRFRVEVLPLR